MRVRRQKSAAPVQPAANRNAFTSGDYTVGVQPGRRVYSEGTARKYYAQGPEGFTSFQEGVGSWKESGRHGKGYVNPLDAMGRSENFHAAANAARAHGMAAGW